MKDYLGEFPVDIKEHTEFSKYTKDVWILKWIGDYGGIDGAHHKDWVLDQVAQIVNGAEIIVVQAKWGCGHSEYRFNLESNSTHDDWVKSFEGDYDAGSAP